MNKLQNHTFTSKEDFQSAFLELMQPLRAYYTEAKPGRLSLGTSGTVYMEETQEVEAFLRPLWGFGPYLLHGDDDELLEKYLTGIISGTDPDSPDFWGQPDNYDQLLVEMAALSTTLLLVKEETWDRLTIRQQDNLYNWLITINERTIPSNNWHFFRILVNVAMKKCDRAYSQEMIDQDLALMNSYYKGNGWYYDGVETQIDYYISFGFHYYGLLYAKFMEKDDPEQAQIFKDRAVLFARSFKLWFDGRGEALPFGRSLTYRFAQCAFWSALVFADVEALPWGEIKGLLARNMHNWLDRSIFTTDGLLSIGYYYQNLVMAEGYNAPGSPYWSFKSFLILAVADDHPFWQAEPLDYQLSEKQNLISEAQMLMVHNDDLTHLQAFVAGQFIENQVHGSAKYSKLVYSSVFGFSTPKAAYHYYESALDSCLAVSEGEHYFRTKDHTTGFSVLADRVINDWQPYPDVTIRTTVMPFGEWHIRVHEIHSERDLTVIDGGFSAPGRDPKDATILPQTASYVSEVGTTVVMGLQGYDSAEVVTPEPNTNLLYQNTSLPCLHGKIKKGKTILASLMGGVTNQEKELTIPAIVFNEQAETITVKFESQVIEMSKLI